MANDFLADTKPVDFDATVDDAIKECLELGADRSFITFAGAGSGKTYSLERALHFLKHQYEQEFVAIGKQVAVVTFTNNAADEISDRVDRSPIFAISTIHSFCWQSILGFDEDIRHWYLATIPDELSDLAEKERRGRVGAASEARKRSIARLTTKLEWLSKPRTFKYDPNGVNSEQNALSHSEVLNIFSYLVLNKPMMGQVLADKFPFFFVDESQDTDRSVINALFQLQKMHNKRITVGLFGDTMQRIFGGGEPMLGATIPAKDWIRFDKQMNHRSARRVIGLGNKIRETIDGRNQFARNGASDGIVRFFLLPGGTLDKEAAEIGIREQMATITDDVGWNTPKADDTAVLLLEHKMVSRRLGFETLIDALTKSKRIGERIFEGENGELNFFAKVILPIVEAGQANDDFLVMSLLREYKSPLLEEGVLSKRETDPLLMARKAEHALRKAVKVGNATMGDVLAVIAEHNLLMVPPKLRNFVEQPSDDGSNQLDLSDIFDDAMFDAIDVNALHPTSVDDETDAWLAALSVPFAQVAGYRNYVNEEAIYRTHQGVKGNEFERVMAIENDEEAGGFLFSYEQFLGAKAPSANTLAKIAAGDDTGFSRTRRLFYVISTRAKSSLAHVIYTANIDGVRDSLIAQGFAKPDEIIEG